MYPVDLISYLRLFTRQKNNYRTMFVTAWIAYEPAFPHAQARQLLFHRENGLVASKLKSVTSYS